MRTDEGVILAQDWAAGFLAAVRLRLTGGWSEKFEGGFGFDIGRHWRVLCNQGVDSFQSSEEAVRRVDHRVDLDEAVDPTVLDDHVVADLGQWRQAAAHPVGVVLAPSLEHVTPA